MTATRLLLIPAFILISMSACTGEAEEPAAEQVEISLQKAMAVYGGDGLDEEPFLGRVRGVITDSQGNHYVYDGDAKQFITYDAEGNYLTSFGREGSGPGEIQSVFTMLADRQGRLIVADGTNSRITVFDGEDGTFLFNEPQHGIQSIRDISELDDGRFLVMGWHPERERMIHILNSDFSEIEHSLAHPDEISNEEDAQRLNLIQTMAGSAEMLNDGRILFAPRVYNGSLYLFEEEGETWAVADTVSGWSAVQNPLQTASGSTDMMERYPTNSMISIMISDGGMTITYSTSSSHGLYPTGDGSLIHLSSHFSEEEGVYQMVLERFDPETVTLSRYGTIPLEVSNSTRTQWVDSRGSLYQTNSDSVGFWKMDVEGLM